MNHVPLAAVAPLAPLDLTFASPSFRRLVIIGGGAGGLELAIRLSRQARRAAVTLVDRRATHIWKPRLHEIATGLLVPAEEEVSYAAMATSHGFTFALGAVTALDIARQQVSIASVAYPPDLRDGGRDELLPARTLDFDLAVLAVGSTVNDFGTPGVAEHCHVLDTPDQAQRLHRAFLALATRVAAGQIERMRVAVVGAGLTGVELAAELRTAAHRLSQYRSLLNHGQLEIAVVEMADRPLPSVAPDVSAFAKRILAEHDVAMHFSAKVARVEANGLVLADGRHIPADLTVWASGVRGNPLAERVPGLSVDRGGRIAVDGELRALAPDGTPHLRLYCIGDCAAYRPQPDSPPVSATAQAAHQQAQLLARSIARQMRGGSPLRFRYRYKGTLVSLGESQAAGDVPTTSRTASLRVRGVTAKLLYTSLYRMHQAELFGWGRTLALALSNRLRRYAMPSVKLHWP